MKVFNLALTMLALVWSSCILAADPVPNIKKITSEKSAQEVSTTMPEPSRIPGEINLHSLGVGIGQTFLSSGDFKDNGDDSITGELFYGYSASHSFDFVANLHYSKHEFSGHYVELPGLALGIKAKLYQFDSFSPYILGGLGFYRPKVKRTIGNGLVESESKTSFGDHFGAGAELKLNRHYSMGLLAHYHNPFDIKQDSGPEVEGSYFKLLITGLYFF